MKPTMKAVNKRLLIISLLLIIPVAAIVFADVVYYYSGNITVRLATQPLIFATGPNGNVPNYIQFQGTDTGFTVSLYITNSSAAYFYQAGKLTVNTPGYIYISSISISGSNLVSSMTIYIQNANTEATEASFTIISGGDPASTPSSVYSLSSGTYYISIYVVPNTPLPQPSTGATETITVTFGYNLVSNTAVPTP